MTRHQRRPLVYRIAEFLFSRREDMLYMEDTKLCNYIVWYRTMMEPHQWCDDEAMADSEFCHAHDLDMAYSDTDLNGGTE